MWSPETGWGDAKYVRFIISGIWNVFKPDFPPQVLESHNLCPIKLGAKEGLAMINGTQLVRILQQNYFLCKVVYIQMNASPPSKAHL